jgi:heme exporter protein CcmD
MTWTELITMDGHGFYVWTAYCLLAVALGAETLILRRRSKARRVEATAAGRHLRDRTGP